MWWEAVLPSAFEQGIKIVLLHVRRPRSLNSLKIEKTVPSDSRGARMSMGDSPIASHSKLPRDVPAIIDLGVKLRHTKLDQAGNGGCRK